MRRIDHTEKGGIRRIEEEREGFILQREGGEGGEEKKEKD